MDVLNRFRTLVFHDLKKRDLEIALALGEALPVKVAMFTRLEIEQGQPGFRHVNFQSPTSFGSASTVADSLKPAALKKQMRELAAKWVAEFHGLLQQNDPRGPGRPTREEFDAWVDELNRQADQEETKLEGKEASCTGT